MIFTISVSFSRDNALFASPFGPLRSKIFHKTLILVFEVIVQLPKTHFLTFSSETKIMKITHSAKVGRNRPNFGLVPTQSGFQSLKEARRVRQFQFHDKDMSSFISFLILSLLTWTKPSAAQESKFSF